MKFQSRSVIEISRRIIRRAGSAFLELCYAASFISPIAIPAPWILEQLMNAQATGADAHGIPLSSKEWRAWQRLTQGLSLAPDDND